MVSAVEKEEVSELPSKGKRKDAHGDPAELRLARGRRRSAAGSCGAQRW